MTPNDYEPHNNLWVHRPNRHYGGNHFVIREDNEADVGWYASPLFPKEHEYRLMFVKGHHIITMKKVVPENTEVDRPWNHSCGSRFITIGESGLRPRILRTDVIEKLQQHYVVQKAHLLAVDVMYNSSLGYAVCEINFCPALTIEANIRRIADEYHRISSQG